MPVIYTIKNKLEYEKGLRENLPASMLSARRWLLYKLIEEPGKEKPRKVPFYASGAMRNGKLDTPEDLGRLVSFDDAVSAFKADKAMSGIGFALGADMSGNYWQGVDLDDLAKWEALQGLVKEGLPGYSEKSISGGGWHCIGYGKSFQTLGSTELIGIEAYCKGRFFTMSGDESGGDIECLAAYVCDTLQPIYSRYTGKGAGKGKKGHERFAVTQEVIKDLRSALNFLNRKAFDYESWIAIGLALKTIEPDDVGFGLWLDWSAFAPSFDRDECVKKWASFEPENTDYRAVFAKATRGGWVNPFSMDEEDWRAKLLVETTKKGRPKVLARMHNYILMLRHLPGFVGRLRLNELSDCIELDGSPMQDADIDGLRAEMEHHIDFAVPGRDLLGAVGVVAKENLFHPIRDYMNGLEWDGVPRVARFFIDCFGAEDNEYHRDAALSFFVSAVARVMRPGCKVDTMIILEGDQGIGKSTAVLELFGMDWHAEVQASVGDKDFYQNLRGKWVVEFGEMSGITKADSNHIKQILTIRSDHYRASFGRLSKDYPRQNIFFGTTNDKTYLKDQTGGRRYFPVACEGDIDVATITGNRNQLWAEAYRLWQRGHKWWTVRGSEDEQEKRYVGDEWEGEIGEWLSHPGVASEYAAFPQRFTTTKILTELFGFKLDKVDSGVQVRLGKCMSKLGYVPKRDNDNGRRYYVKKPSKNSKKSK